ncbi:MAG: penicillin-binding protein 1A, partial [Lysobacteraceae bacterium]
WLRRLVLAGLVLLVLAVAGLGVLYWLIVPGLPDVEGLRDVDLQMPLNVFSREGKLIAQFGETRRYPVTISQVPMQLRQAVIAIEDARFYEHPGVDWRGVSRAVWLLATTKDKRVPGGSTITQQVARQFFLSTEYSYSRKLREMALALKIERELSKDEILALYLNKSFFGNRAYGVAAAAEYYYGKKLEQLTLSEAASLAAIPKFPSSGNPLSNPERSLERRNYVLLRMAELHFISPAQRDAAQADPNHASPHEPVIEVEAPYVAEMVRQAMIDRYGSDALTSGFRVYTTIDSVKQADANHALRNGLQVYDRRHGYRGVEGKFAEIATETDPVLLAQRVRERGVLGELIPALVMAVEDKQADLLLADGSHTALDLETVRWAVRAGKPAKVGSVLARGDFIRLLPIADKPGHYQLSQLPKAQAALVSLEPEDGALRAVVGGFSFSSSKFNRAVQSLRQPGSSFKPFIYSAAFERGFTPSSIVLDAPVMFRDRAGHVWRPQNDSGNFVGPIRLREALVHSRNLVSVRLLDAIGVDFAWHYVQAFGFSPQSIPQNLSMSLGTASVPPLAIARGYAVFTNGGYLIQPYFIDRVLDRDGITIARAHPARACDNCVERAQQETVASTVVDGFDLGLAGDALLAPAPADSAVANGAGTTAEVLPPAPLPEIKPYDPDFVGPPSVFPANRAIDGRNAFLIESLMKDVIKRGTGMAAKVLDREDIGGKTGTTNDHRDAWFSGFGGHLVTTVWVGMDDFSTLGHGEYGARAALPIWVDYMRAALKDVPLRAIEPPPGVVTVSIDRGSGRLLPDGTPGAMTEFFKSEDLTRAETSTAQYGADTKPEESFDIF